MQFADLVPHTPQEGPEQRDYREEQEFRVAGPRPDKETASSIHERERDLEADGEKGPVLPFTSRNTLVSARWFFVFFNKQPDVGKLDRFRSEFERLRNGASLSRILGSPSRRKRLRMAYERIFGKRNLNDTTLAVLSGYAPLPRRGMDIHVSNGVFAPWRPWRWWHPHPFPHRRVWTIPALDFMGDLPASELWESIAPKFHLYDGPRRRQCTHFFYQVPHHGSEHNWHEAFDIERGLAE